MATPTFDEIRREAVADYQSDKVREQGDDFTGNAPEDSELREGGYFYRAQRKLMKQRGRTSLGRRATLLPGKMRTVENIREERHQRQETEPVPHMVAPEPRLLPVLYRGPQKRATTRGPPALIREEKVAQRETVRPESRAMSQAERSAVEKQRRRGETFEETKRRLEVEGTRVPAGPVAVPAVPRALAPAPKKGVRGGRLRPAEAPRVARERPKPVRRVSGLETRLERVPHETYSLYGKAGSLVIYPEVGPFGRKFYRVKFQGRTFTPTFDTPEQAMSFANGLKARTEPEYAARRERMVEADSRYFAESTIAHRQHPLFVKVIDRSGRAPPGRLTA